MPLKGYGANGERMGLGATGAPYGQYAGAMDPNGGGPVRPGPVETNANGALVIPGDYSPMVGYGTYGRGQGNEINSGDTNGRTSGDGGVVAADTGPLAPKGYIPQSAYEHDPNTWDLGQHLNGQVDPYDSYSADAIRAMASQQQQGAQNGGVYSAQRPGMNAVQLARSQQGYSTQDPNNAVLAAYNQFNGQAGSYGLGGTMPQQAPPVPQGPVRDASGFTAEQYAANPNINKSGNSNVYGPMSGQQLNDEYAKAWGSGPAQTYVDQPGYQAPSVDRGATGPTGRERGGA